MTVYTKTWKKKKKAVNDSKHAYDKLSATQKKQIGQAKSYQATIDTTTKSIQEMKNAQMYYYKNDKTKKKGKNGKTTTKKVKVKRKKPRPLTKAQQKQMNDYNQQLKTANGKLSALKKSTSYKKAASKLKTAKNTAKSKQAAYDNYMKKRHKKALSRVAAQRRENYARFMAPHASLHATNSLTGLEVFLFATDETESNDSNATTYPIDNDDPVTDHVQRTGKTVTINAYLYDQKAGKRLWAGMKDDVSGKGLPKKSCRQQYNNLKKWQFDGTEMVYKSNAANDNKQHVFNKIYYKHLFMTNLTKTLDAPLLGMMKVSMTFQFAYKAKVTTTSKGTKNNKGKKTVGGQYIGAKYIKVKKGMTYWGLAKKYGTTVAQLRKWNGSEKLTMYPGKNGKYPVKLRVTKGATSKSIANSVTKNKTAMAGSAAFKKIAKQLGK